jgi:hypothetical protein
VLLLTTRTEPAVGAKKMRRPALITTCRDPCDSRASRHTVGSTSSGRRSMISLRSRRVLANT